MPKKKKSKKNTKQRKFILRASLYLSAAIAFLLLIFILVVLMGGLGELPHKAALKKVRNYTASSVYSSDNYLLGRYYLENRTNASIEDLPDYFINALVATEDARFYKHHGVDTRSTFRVLFKSILLNKSTGGGSTITQQLAKNLYPRKNIGLLTLPAAKLREIIIAKRLEKVYTKSEILQLYLNTVPFGDNTYGIETAALVFFNKKPADLNIQESAVLVGMLKGNTDYNPARNYEASFQRRNLVLQQMVNYNYLEQAKADSLKKINISLNYRKLKHDEGSAPYFREYLRQYLKKWTEDHPKYDGSNYNIYTDGLKIYTTINYELQTVAENAMKNHLTLLQKEFNRHWQGKEPWNKNTMLAEKEIKNSKRYKSLENKGFSEEEILKKMDKPVKTKLFTWEGEKEVTLSPIDSVLYYFAMLQAGFISMESKTGFVKAWVGGINYKYFKYDHVTSHRQAGSTFKPFVYATALEQGIEPCDFFKNDSVVYEEYDSWTPRNADRKYGGMYSMRGALAHSVNTVSAKILLDMGIKKVTSVTEEYGFRKEMPAVPSLALGTGEVSLYELVQAYSVFLNKGHRVTPILIRRIEDAEGNVIFSQGPEISKEQVISEKNAELMTAMLKGVVDYGTASSLHTVYGLQGDLAGKTGTTQNQTDGWFVGLTPDLISAVWVGGDNPVIRFRSITYGQGSYMALPIFARYLQGVYRHPIYQGLQNTRFHISDETLGMLDCPEFKEEEIETLKDLLDKTEESINDFIKRIFRKRKKNRDNNDNE